MKNSNKLLALFLSLLMVVSLAGCNLDSTGISDNSQASVPDTVSDSQAVTDRASSDNPTETTEPTTESKPSGVGNITATPVEPSGIAAYSGKAYAVINDNQPNFSASELSTAGYEKYSELDSLGRCGVVLASCGKDTMPGANEERGSISSIKPSGWVQAKYDGISGGYLWNRCHLIGWQLSAENANRKNLITGTRYMNIEGMLTFENMVADYIKETNHHVAYRVTPIYEGNNLVCSGVQIEAYSVEDRGEGICFNVYCYNVQPGITIDYATGNSSGPQSSTTSKPETTKPAESVTQPPAEQPGNTDMVWIPKSGSKYHSRSSCSNMKNPTQVSRSEAIRRGYEPCKKCY